MSFPQILRIRQTFDPQKVDNIAAAVQSGVQALPRSFSVKPGQTVAVACSSRGINNYGAIVKEVVVCLKALELNPFIFPAMGSHGSATAKGQQQVLAHLGITEASTGAPVRSALDVIQIGETSHGVPVLLDKLASEADHIVLINRIKKHTEFEHEFESGLLKMMAIGIGKQAGAARYHQAMFSYGYADVIGAIADVVMQKTPILFGVGIVENGHGQTAKIGICPRDQIKTQEIELLKLAKELAPSLPFKAADILFIDEMGKEISGTGFDTKVVGRIGMPLVSPDPEYPKIKRIVVGDLTDDTEGNATGVGIADFITQRLFNKIDRQASDMNNITGLSPEMGKIPIALSSDQEALAVAVRCLGLVSPEKLKIIRIKNTSELGEVEISEAYGADLQQRDDLEIMQAKKPWEFDADGNLPPF
ncbi:MAG: DUF2088 domain-containing protein [Deltaproteobacteria bacterium]|nr:DUF2088 domain-containing protein [Deltaproteobacteria bacterium]